MSQLKILGDTACPRCQAKGRDRTGNHLILLENDKGERFGKCNRCNYFSPPDKEIKITERKIKTPEEIAEELQEASECPIQSLESRSISLQVATRFGVRVGLSCEDGKSVIQHLYPKTIQGNVVGYKIRNLTPKYFYSVGKASGTEPFGYPQAQLSDTSRKKLIIAEDELSAMSIYQVLEASSSEKWRHIKPCVISLPDGTGSVSRTLSELSKFTSQFEEVILCFDNDEAGRKAVDSALSLLPKCKVVFFPLKDANDMLMAGRDREIISAILFHAQRKKPEGVATVMDSLDEALVAPVMGLSYPWQRLTDMTFGQRLGEIVGVGGGVGLGKTTIAHEIAAWNAVVHKQKSFMIMLEENNGDTIKNVCGKIDSFPYHRPDFNFNKDKLRETAESINEFITLWKSNINQEDRYDISSIVRAIRYQAVANGVKHVFFDNITAVTQHLSSAEINTEVGKIAQQFAGLADELDIQIFIFSHLNTPNTGKAHEEGGEVREHQFTGSRALMRWCQVIIGFERNKHANGEAKHMSHIRLLKHRKFGTTGIAKTQYDPSTGRLNQREDDSPDDITANADDNQSF